MGGICALWLGLPRPVRRAAPSSPPSAPLCVQMPACPPGLPPSSGRTRLQSRVPGPSRASPLCSCLRGVDAPGLRPRPQGFPHAAAQHPALSPAGWQARVQCRSSVPVLGGPWSQGSLCTPLVLYLKSWPRELPLRPGRWSTTITKKWGACRNHGPSLRQPPGAHGPHRPLLSAPRHPAHGSARYTSLGSVGFSANGISVHKSSHLRHRENTDPAGRGALAGGIVPFAKRAL